MFDLVKSSRFGLNESETQHKLFTVFNELLGFVPSAQPTGLHFCLFL